MSSIDAGANLSRIASPSSAVVAPQRRRSANVASIVGGFFLTGVFLALCPPVFAVSMVFSFIWWAQH